MGIEFNNVPIIYLWKEQYLKEDRIRLEKDIIRIISTLKN